MKENEELLTSFLTEVPRLARRLAKWSENEVSLFEDDLQNLSVSLNSVQTILTELLTSKTLAVHGTA